MSKLTDSGIEASIAGTSLRNILLKMQDPSSDLTKAFGGTIHSLDQLVPAMKSFISEGGSMADIMEVVDLRQAAAFEQMLTTADGTLELRDALLAAGGEGARMAGIVGDTLQGAFLKFTSAIQGVSISLMKNYNVGLQKSIEKMAQWMNGLVDNIDGVVRLISWVKRIVTGLVAYKLGMIALTVATNVFTKATYRSILSIKSFTKALAKTGVGLLVIALGDLIYSLATFNKEARDAADWTGKLSDGMKTEEESVGALEVSLNRLVEAKKHIDQFSKEEVKQLDKASYEYKIYAKNLIVATQETNTLNQAFKSNGQELITLQTDISDTQQKFSDLAQQMRNTAAVSVASQMSADIIQTKMEVDNLMNSIKNTLGEDIGEGTILDIMKDLAKDGSFESWVGDVAASLNDLVGGTETAFVTVKRAIEDTDISMGDFIKYAEKGKWYKGEETGTAMMSKDLDAINAKLLELFPNFEDFIKLTGESKKKSGIEGDAPSIDKSSAALVKNTVMQDLATAAKWNYVDTMKEVLEGTITAEEAEKKLVKMSILATTTELDGIRETIMNGQLRLDLEEKLIQLRLKNREIVKKTEEEEKASRVQAISDLKDMGNQLITIAGEEENLQAIKKIGIQISMAAAIASNFEAMAKYGAAIADAALKSPWWMKIINVIGLIGAMASTLSMMKSMKNSFGEGGVVETFADGGMVQGKSHAQGGEKFAVGGRVVELEGGEAVINKRSTAMYRGELSAMNSAGGGVKFADGGLLNSPAFAQQQFSGMRNSGGGGAQKVFVVESDISQSQHQVSVLEANATL